MEVGSTVIISFKLFYVKVFPWEVESTLKMNKSAKLTRGPQVRISKEFSLISLYGSLFTRPFNLGKQWETHPLLTVENHFYIIMHLCLLLWSDWRLCHIPSITGSAIWPPVPPSLALFCAFFDFSTLSPSHLYISLTFSFGFVFMCLV